MGGRSDARICRCTDIWVRRHPDAQAQTLGLLTPTLLVFPHPRYVGLLDFSPVPPSLNPRRVSTASLGKVGALGWRVSPASLSKVGGLGWCVSPASLGKIGALGWRVSPASLGQVGALGWRVSPASLGQVAALGWRVSPASRLGS